MIGERSRAWGERWRTDRGCPSRARSGSARSPSGRPARPRPAAGRARPAGRGEPADPRRGVRQPQPGDERHEPAGRGDAVGRPRAPGRRSATRATSTRWGWRRSSRSRSSPPSWPPRSSGPGTPRCGSPPGALANLYAFMATCEPGDTIIAPPAEIGGHVTHHGAGAAGLYGLQHRAGAGRRRPATPSTSTRCARWPARSGPTLITIGGSLNLFPHPVGRDPGDRRRGRRQGAVRRRAPVRHDRRPGLAATRSTRART